LPFHSCDSNIDVLVLGQLVDEFFGRIIAQVRDASQRGDSNGRRATGILADGFDPRSGAGDPPWS